MVARQNNSTRAAVDWALSKAVTGGAVSVAQRQSWDADSKLVQSAAGGDAKAQRELLHRALPVARRTARYLLRRSQDVDDAVQATLLAVLNSAARFRGCSSLATWVGRIATRTTLRLAQKQRALVPTGELEKLPAPERSEYEAEETPRTVWEYVECLPELQRVAIVLRYKLDYSVDDIAEATESPPDTVKYRLKEALTKIRRLVRQDLAVRGQRDDGGRQTSG
jgi:RNA polymerase sigma-70 factor (ECF subfamily)